MKPFGHQIVAEFVDCSQNILNDPSALEEIIGQGAKKSNVGILKTSSHQFDPIGVTITAIVSESHIAVHTYPEARHVSLDIFTCSPDPTKAHTMLTYLKSELEAKTIRTLVLARGIPLEIKEQNWITTSSGYGFETRYHVKENVLSQKLKYQQIDIIENENFGRMLFLDKELQIAEKDASLYHTHVVNPIINQRKTLEHVVILGGGDGGLLHEILKHQPKRVTVVEIEEKMPELSQKYLRCICQNAFSEPQVNIVYYDANHYLKMNTGFDVIMYDLTMHPASFTYLERKTFLNQIFENSRQGLNKDGILSLQCCPEFDEETFNMLKPILLRNFSNVCFEKAFIPSFSENLIFCTAQK
ncbi:MAG: adenosylmethionine decarboxylase [Kiritimatiellae bacterium]|nr:adenosylmethionine decarboxylase [Kiritimatiellia bacterium]